MKLPFIISACIVVTACNNEPSIEPWPESTTVISAKSEVEPAAAIESQEDSVITLTGLDFINEDFSTSSLIAPTVLSLKHFGGVSTTFTLEQEVKKAEFLFKTRGPEGLYPRATVMINTAHGKYASHRLLDNEEISTNGSVTKPVTLAAGSYVLSIGYHSASDPTRRPPLDIHWFTFK